MTIISYVATILNLEKKILCVFSSCDCTSLQHTYTGSKLNWKYNGMMDWPNTIFDDKYYSAYLNRLSHWNSLSYITRRFQYWGKCWYIWSPFCKWQRKSRLFLLSLQDSVISKITTKEYNIYDVMFGQLAHNKHWEQQLSP